MAAKTKEYEFVLEVTAKGKSLAEAMQPITDIVADHATVTRVHPTTVQDDEPAAAPTAEKA